MFVRFRLPETVNNLAEEYFATNDTLFGFSGYPALEMAEYDHESVIVAELPGVKKEDVKISVEDGILTLSGVRKPYEIPRDARILLNEVRVREFRRSIELAHDVDVNNVTAELENGLLTIRLPKSENARVRTIEVK